MNTSSSLDFRPIKRVHFDSPLFSSRQLSTPSSPPSPLISPYNRVPRISESISTDFVFDNHSYSENDNQNFEPKRSLSLDTIFLLPTKAASINFPINCPDDSELKSNSIAAQFFNAMFKIPFNSTTPLTLSNNFKHHTEKDDFIFATDSASSLLLNSTTNSSSQPFTSPIHLPSTPIRNIKQIPHLKNLEEVSTSNSREFSSAQSKDFGNSQSPLSLNHYLNLPNSSKNHRSRSVQKLVNAITSILNREGTGTTKSPILNKKGEKESLKKQRQLSNNSLRCLPNSRTFPMSRNDAKKFSKKEQTSHPEEEFNEDFVPYSYAAKESRNSLEENPALNAKIRRMSLKEFSGLEVSTTPNKSLDEDLTSRARNDFYPPVSPYLRRPSSATATAPINYGMFPLPIPRFQTDFCMGSLIEKFSSRRRSSASLNKIQHIPSSSGEQFRSFGENLYDSFDKALDAIDLAIQEICEPSNMTPKKLSIEEDLKSFEGMNFSPQQKNEVLSDDLLFRNMFQRLNEIREHLNSTLQNIPNASPKKFENIKNKKLEMLSETRFFVAHCKILIRTTSLAVNVQELQEIMKKCVESVNLVTSNAEILIQKANSLFQAQLMTAKTDQMLKALIMTLEDVKHSIGAPKYGNAAKQLFRSSTTLAATLNQLILAVQHL